MQEQQTWNKEQGLDTCLAGAVSLHNGPMYGLPPEFPCDKFIGLELTRVAFTATNCILNFDDQIEINVLSSFYVLDPDGARHDESLPPTSGRIVALIGARIVACVAQESGELRLSFDTEWDVCLEDSAFPFISYEINMLGRKLVSLPPDPSLFLGRRLEAFSYTNNFATLPFGQLGDLRIEVDHVSLTVRDNEGPVTGNASELLRRIAGQSVISAARGPETDFSLTFQNGVVLTLGVNSSGQTGYRVFEGGISVTV